MRFVNAAFPLSPPPTNATAHLRSAVSSDPESRHAAAKFASLGSLGSENNVR